jgi:hypothetical protein
MNWGYRIIFIYTAFVAGIVFMAVMSFRQPLDMDTENYYEAEKGQDDRMHQRMLGNTFIPLIKINNEQSTLSFELPTDITEKPNLQGQLKLTRPSDAKLDKTISFDKIELGVLSVDKSELKSGFWKYSLEWSHSFGHYLIEDTLIIK